MITGWRLTFRIITQCQKLMGNHLTEFYIAQNEIHLSVHSLILLGVPYWPSMSSSTNDLPRNTVSGGQQAGDTPDKEAIDLKSDLRCTPDPTKTITLRKIVGVENVEGNVYSKATELYNKHCK